MTFIIPSGFGYGDIVPLWLDLGSDLLGWEICWLMFLIKCVNKKNSTHFLSIMVNSWHFKKMYYLAVAMTLIVSSQMYKD